MSEIVIAASRVLLKSGQTTETQTIASCSPAKQQKVSHSQPVSTAGLVNSVDRSSVNGDKKTQSSQPTADDNHVKPISKQQLALLLSAAVAKICASRPQNSGQAQLDDVRRRLAGQYDKPRPVVAELASVYDRPSNTVKVSASGRNRHFVKQMMLEREPIRFQYEDQRLFDKQGVPLFIEWRGVSPANETAGGLGHLLKGDFYLRGLKSSQPTRLLRLMLKMAGFPKELYDSHQSSPGSRLRAYECLTVRLGNRQQLYRLKDLFPYDTRRSVLPRKPRAHGGSHTSLSSDESLFKPTVG